jgi:hypothetical protein
MLLETRSNKSFFGETLPTRRPSKTAGDSLAIHSICSCVLSGHYGQLRYDQRAEEHFELIVLAAGGGDFEMVFQKAMGMNPWSGTEWIDQGAIRGHERTRLFAFVYPERVRRRIGQLILGPVQSSGRRSKNGDFEFFALIWQQASVA